MKYRQLIYEAERHLETYPGYLAGPALLAVFNAGGQWMHCRLNELRNSSSITNSSIPYSVYGFMKYSICLFAFFLSIVALGKLSLILLPLSIIAFYIFEIHFLFLFPLLIDGVANPLKESVRLTYKVGFVKALVTVMPIGFFMVWGLLQPGQRFRNWHIGCMAVLIWYNNEVGNRF